MKWMFLLLLTSVVSTSCTKENKMGQDQVNSHASAMEKGDEEKKPDCDDPDKVVEKIKKEAEESNQPVFSLEKNDAGCSLDEK
ncbi:MAG: hypothetical protein H6621_12170 [Halobacteriovoraceae bacterium]|nr:hypothetical protein [Halobacteriovoraceae bacterium]MCB9095816.1 hypothetical protein [Halobacteriovoraceae bacterium]